MKIDIKSTEYILDNMKSIAQFRVFKDKNTYVAEGVDLSIVTESNNLDDLMKNIEEAVSLYFENEKASDFDYSPKPSILVSYELLANA